MTPEALGIIDRLFKAAVLVPVLVLVAWWIFTSLLDKTLSVQEGLAGAALLGAALVLGAISIARGGWGFLGVLALVYVAVLALAAWEYVFWRRRDRDRLIAGIGKYREAVERDPSNAAAYSFLGETYLKLRRFEEAASAFEKALELDPQSKRDRTLLQQARERRPAFKWWKVD